MAGHGRCFCLCYSSCPCFHVIARNPSNWRLGRELEAPHLLWVLSFQSTLFLQPGSLQMLPGPLRTSPLLPLTGNQPPAPWLPHFLLEQFTGMGGVLVKSRVPGPLLYVPRARYQASVSLSAKTMPFSFLPVLQTFLYDVTSFSSKTKIRPEGYIIITQSP